MKIDFTLEQLKILQPILEWARQRIENDINSARDPAAPLKATPGDYRFLLDDLAALQAEIDRAIAAS